MRVMCRQTAVIKLEDKYNSMVQNITKNIFSAKYFCTTADIWSGNHRSFIGYTCHWISDSLERKSVALACKRVLGVHSAEKIAQMVTEINTAFGLSSANIVRTVTDNGSNFVKAFKAYGVGSSFSGDEIDEDLPIFENKLLLPKHQRCCSHTLNLLASTDFDKILKTEQALYIQHTMTFEKCNNVWKKCKWPKSSEIIKKCLGSALLLPVITRWNSLYDAVQKLLRFKELLNDMCDKLSLAQFSLGDLRYLEMYTLVMQPIAEALDFLQGEKNVNYGFLIPTLITLSNKLQKLRKNIALQEMSSIILKTELQLRKRFDIYFDLKPEAHIAIAATVLTPAIKMKWLKVLQRSNPEFTEQNVTTIVLDTLCNFYDKGNNINKFENLENTSNSATILKHFDFDIDDDIDTIASSQATTKPDQRTILKTQLIRYLNENLSSEEVWQKYVLLKEPYIAFNTPLTSSAPVERLFSFAGIINSPRRQSLSDFSLEKLVLMKANAEFI